MKALSTTLGACALCVLFGALPRVSAQTKSNPPQRSAAHRTSDELNRLLASAQAALDKHDYETAAQDYQEYIEKKPDDALVHYNLGYVYTALQQFDEARAEYEKAIALDPEDPKMAPAYQNLGLTLLQTDPAAAVDPLQHAAELAPDDARTKWLLGVALDGSGKTAEAIEQFEAAEKLDDKDADIRLSLGMALLRSGRTEDSESHFREALAMNPSAVTASQAHKGLAEVLIAQKHLAEAATELAAYLETQPNDVEMRVERASALVDLNRDEEALAELDRAASQEHEGLRALKLRSQIYYQAKRYDDAIPVLQRAEALAPKDPDLPTRLGNVYLDKKDYAGAIRQLAAAHNLDPKAADILSSLMIAEYMSQNYAATLDLLAALEKQMQLPTATWFIRANCYDKLGQPAEALDAFQKFLQLNKDENSDMYFESAARARALKRELQEKKR